MITIRCNPYTDAEVQMLYKILRRAEVQLQVECCKDKRCDECEYRHLCYDLDKCSAHMRNLKQMIEL